MMQPSRTVVKDETAEVRAPKPSPMPTETNPATVEPPKESTPADNAASGDR